MEPTKRPSRSGFLLRAGALVALIAGLGIASLKDPTPIDSPRAGVAVVSAAHPSEDLERAVDEVSTITDEVLDWAESTLGRIREIVDDPTGDAKRVVADSVGIRLLAPIQTDGDNDSGADAGDGSDLDWQPLAAAAPKRLVILVHGLDEPGNIWDELAPAIRAQGLAVARFDYPNDQGIADSTDLFAKSLEQLCAAGTTRIDLVCHSMGGLVARDLLTRDDYYAGDGAHAHDYPAVWRVITVGTPNYGAPLAPLRGLAEVRDQLARLVDDDDISLGDLLRFSSDGNGEAGTDLTPGSAFLTDLNARPLPHGVRWTIIAGRVAQTDDIRKIKDTRLTRAMGIDDDLDELLGLLVPISDDFGDGAVPVSSTPLPGIEDIVHLEANHRSMLRTIGIERSIRQALGDTPDEVPPAIPVIIDRLLEPIAQPPAAPSSAPPED